MTFAIEAVETVADPAALEALLRDYIDWTAEGFEACSSRRIDRDAYVAATLGNLPAYLPPKGRLILARDAADALVGMVFVKTIRPDTAEFKRLYVSPAARGSGLGRRLTLAAVDAARELGARQLFLDTGRWMEGALTLYRGLGFREIGAYAESENDPSLAPHLVYLALPIAP